MDLPENIQQEIVKAHKVARVHRLHDEVRTGIDARRHEDREKVVMFTCSQALYNALMDEADKLLSSGEPNIAKAARKILGAHFGIREEVADHKSFAKTIKTHQETVARKLTKSHLDKLQVQND